MFQEMYSNEMLCTHKNKCNFFYLTLVKILIVSWSVKLIRNRPQLIIFIRLARYLWPNDFIFKTTIHYFPADIIEQQTEESSILSASIIIFRDPMYFIPLYLYFCLLTEATNAHTSPIIIYERYMSLSARNKIA